ncbi:MAG TPA: hypothetical protein DCX53_13530 [Anaerolineae bacterium]|nr:hypothetical protein [Anaerolineae bacterium]
MSFNVGENIGPYRIIEQLGQGGMASVFKAYHASLDRYVAIKALHPAFNQDPNFEARFQREARVVAKLEHSNIVPVYDYAEHEKRPYLIMKFVEGETLKWRMDQGPLTADEITRIVDAVGSALSYAHKQGVLHRDIKPSNVLLSEDGQIYLADFGLARMAQAGESTLSSDMMMGTPQYISPEQAMGKSDLDNRTDLYSFGVMLYEMVVGKVPFSADTPFSIIHDHIYSPLPLPRVVNPAVPESVERVLLKALAKERDDRFDDSAKLVEAFKSAWNDAGVPMQGSDLSASQVLHVDKETVIPQRVDPTRVASAPAKGTKKKPDEPEAIDISKKKRSRWIWIGAGSLVIMCLCLGILTQNNRREANLTQDLGGNQKVSVNDALEFAMENPEDPEAQLDLALAYWDADQPRKVEETLPLIVKAAGPDDEEFYWSAGDDFASTEAWIPASAMYFQAVRIYNGSGGAPEDLTEAFHESMYKGAERPEAAAFLQFDALSDIDQSMVLIAKARNALYSNRVEDGRAYLNQARRLHPDLAEVKMLQAEFDRHDGNLLPARNAVKELTSNPEVPEWLRIFAEEFLKRTP